MTETKQDRLIRIIMDHSLSKNDFFETVDAEWFIDRVADYSDLSGACVCEYKRCRWVFHIQRKDGKRFTKYPVGLPVGSSCIKHFSPKFRAFAHYLLTLKGLTDKEMKVRLKGKTELYKKIKDEPSLGAWIIKNWAKLYEKKDFRLAVDYARVESNQIPVISDWITLI